MLTRFHNFWLPSLCLFALSLICFLPATLLAQDPTAEGEVVELPADEETEVEETESVQDSSDEVEPIVPVENKEADEVLEEIDADNPGQSYLDQAIDKKINTQSIKDLNEVIDLIDSALEEGLDADNTSFAEQILVASLMQRASSLSGAVLSQPQPDPNQMNRILQLRMFALTDLQRAVSLDENQYEAWMLMGRLQSLAGGNQGEARRALTKVIQYADKAVDDPQLKSIPIESLAQAYALRGAAQRDSKRRLADFTEAVELDPEKVEYLILRAQAHQADKNFDACIADLDKVIETAPDNGKAYEIKALALLMQEKSDEALETFDKATEVAPDSVAPYQYRGELFSKMGRLDEAIEQLDRALEIAPSNLASLLVRAELLLAQADSVEQPSSEEIAEEVEEVDEQEADLERAGEAMGLRTRALTDIEKALRVRPTLIRSHVMRARALSALNREDEALKIMQEIAKAAPNNLEINLQLAAYYIDLGMTQDAIDTLTVVLDIEPDNMVALKFRGDMRLTSGDHLGAVEDFAAAVDLGTDDSGLLNNYAWALATSPNSEIRNGVLAVELATKACEATNFDQAHILSTLASAYAESGDFEEAIKWAEKAVVKAKEKGEEDNYDGQLEAELNSYREGKPWREIQQESGTTAGPEGEERPRDDATEEPAAESRPETDPAEDEGSRSLDF